MRSIFLSTILVFNFHFFEIKAQPYLIPGALQQPAWVFPIFFEDSIGLKDTIYLGYDGIYANNFGCYDDGYFNELKVYHFAFDTNFIALTCIDSYVGGHDSISKIDVMSDITSSFEIYLWGVHFPLKLKWNSFLLFNDSIPFPAVPGQPKAEAILFWDTGSNLPANPSCFFSEILITDTCNYSCCSSDSIIFIDPDNNPGPIGTSFSIRFRPWTGMLIGTEEHEKGEKIRLIPNLVSSQDFIWIDSENNFSKIRIHNIIGGLVSEQQIVSNIIPMDGIENGFYIVELFRENQFVGYLRFIKY